MGKGERRVICRDWPPQYPTGVAEKNRQGKGCVEKSGKIEGKRKKYEKEKERSNEALSKLSTGEAALVSISGA